MLRQSLRIAVCYVVILSLIVGGQYLASAVAPAAPTGPPKVTVLKDAAAKAYIASKQITIPPEDEALMRARGWVPTDRALLQVYGEDPATRSLMQRLLEKVAPALSAQDVWEVSYNGAMYIQPWDDGNPATFEAWYWIQEWTYGSVEHFPAQLDITQGTPTWGRVLDGNARGEEIVTDMISCMWNGCGGAGVGCAFGSFFGPVGWATCFGGACAGAQTWCGINAVMKLAARERRIRTSGCQGQTVNGANDC